MEPGGPDVSMLLARNLLAAIETPGFLVNHQGEMTFFNEAAGILIGHHFQESGRLTREEWNDIGPLDPDGRPMASDQLPLTIALREGRPAFGRFRIANDQGDLVTVDVSAMPVQGHAGFLGAMVSFVPAPPGDPDTGVHWVEASPSPERPPPPRPASPEPPSSPPAPRRAPGGSERAPA